MFRWTGWINVFIHMLIKKTMNSNRKKNKQRGRLQSWIYKKKFNLPLGFALQFSPFFFHGFQHTWSPSFLTQAWSKRWLWGVSTRKEIHKNLVIVFEPPIPPRIFFDIFSFFLCYVYVVTWPWGYNTLWKRGDNQYLMQGGIVKVSTLCGKTSPGGVWTPAPLIR